MPVPSVPKQIYLTSFVSSFPSSYLLFPLPSSRSTLMLSGHQISVQQFPEYFWFCLPYWDASGVPVVCCQLQIVWPQSPFSKMIAWWFFVHLWGWPLTGNFLSRYLCRLHCHFLRWFHTVIQMIFLNFLRKQKQFHKSSRESFSKICILHI